MRFEPENQKFFGYSMKFFNIQQNMQLFHWNMPCLK